MAAYETVGIHYYEFDSSNGGESLVLTTKMIDNGDREIFFNQELTLHSYSNSASFNLAGTALTPENLRELANQLEAEYVRANAKLQD